VVNISSDSEAEHASTSALKTSGELSRKAKKIARQKRKVEDLDVRKRRLVAKVTLPPRPPLSGPITEPRRPRRGALKPPGALQKLVEQEPGFLTGIAMPQARPIPPGIQFSASAYPKLTQPKEKTPDKPKSIFDKPLCGLAGPNIQPKDPNRIPKPKEPSQPGPSGQNK
jgi:hypothetical protein